MEDFKVVLAEEFAPFGTLSEVQLSLLVRHYELLLRWNQKINLTRITSLQEAIEYHYCESLYLARSLPPQALRIVDIGSGAGFPGIPVAVYRPDCCVDLVESHQRKAVFLTETSRQLGLGNVRVLAKRAEEVVELYDWMISRAVKPDDVLRLNLAPNVSVLGTAGEKLPWGDGRALFHVER
jgi:16S rRNA (guanine527-N7)-methyltransferase